MNDWVFLWVKPQRSGLKLRKCQKLSFKFCGPFVITIFFFGKVAYQLDLPKSWRIQNVFHVSLLKKYVLDPFHILPGLPQIL
jgi:hypothetical protein